MATATLVIAHTRNPEKDTETPVKEIKKAEEIRKQYLNNKAK
ncbi:MAG: hypothetical protein WDM90_16245 [Ferruginibacter sp.]